MRNDIRARLDGKFLHAGGSRFLVNGVAYGTFAPDADGYQFPSLDRMAADFAAMRRLRINTVRTYTPPRHDALDAALAQDLRVIVGLAWPQHVAFLDDRRLCRQIRQSMRETVRSLADHPAVLLFSLGNEIPPGVVRWHGVARVARFLGELYDEAKAAAPDSLFTYVNFPPTEFLEPLPFDVCAFNVYLHGEANLRAYISRLQHLAGSRPLLLTEIGADSIREGEEGQAALMAMQLRAAFSGGAAGTVAFTWTDEWWRGGHTVEDWALGIVDAARRPKLAARAVVEVYGSVPFSPVERRSWPRVSVLVCAYNAASTLDDCLTSLMGLTYPQFEVIVVNDGSRDETAAIARRYPGVKVIDTPNRGLSAARNTALEAATGEIVAYTDSDVRVDPDWLTFLVQPFLRSSAAAAGGPNIVPRDDPWKAQCIARSPGGPTQVLLDDHVAEHVPGCNMAFRREALLAVGGFDPIYRAAGDDVDVCWRLQARGYWVGFAPAALVWHHHRPSISAYWRQQVGYGEAETWLMVHHPDKFLDGHARWRGRIYSELPAMRALSRVRVNTGVWGTAPFPSVYAMHWPQISFVPHALLWQLASLVLAALGLAALAAGLAAPGGLLLLTGLFGMLVTLARCAFYGLRSDLTAVSPIGRWPPAVSRVICRATIAWLHFMQPLARSWGRLRGRLWGPQRPDVAGHPNGRDRVWRWTDLALSVRLLLGFRATEAYWSERWLDRTVWLSGLAAILRRSGTGRTVDVDDGWQQARDLGIGLGRWAWLNVRTLVEEHEGGRCLLRVNTDLRPTPLGVIYGAIVLATLVAALNVSSGVAVLPAAAVAAALCARMVIQVARVAGNTRDQVADAAKSAEMLTLAPSAEARQRPQAARGASPSVRRRRLAAAAGAFRFVDPPGPAKPAGQPARVADSAAGPVATLHGRTSAQRGPRRLSDVDRGIR